MTVIYNPNTGIIAKIIFKIEIKKKNKEFESNNSCSSVSFVSTPFPLVCIALSDWISLITPWMSHKNISVLTHEMSWKLRMRRSKEGSTDVTLRGFRSSGNERGLDYSSWHIDRLKSLLTCVWRATNLDHWAAKNLSNRRRITGGVFDRISSVAETVGQAYIYQPDKQESSQIKSYLVICWQHFLLRNSANQSHLKWFDYLKVFSATSSVQTLILCEYWAVWEARVTGPHQTPQIVKLKLKLGSHGKPGAGFRENQKVFTAVVSNPGPSISAGFQKNQKHLR